MQNEKELISVKEAAELTGYSRMHVARLIKDGKISARKIGRSYVVDRSSLGGIFRDITPDEEKKIESVMDKVMDDYGPVLKKLSKE